MRKLKPLLAAAAILAGSLSAFPALADDWQAGAPPEWQKVLDAARKEGHVAVVGPSELAVPIAEAFQKDTAKKFRGLVAVCLKPVQKGPRLREMLLAKAREFLDARLYRADPAAVFFRYRPNGGKAGQPEVAEAYREAAPDLAGLAGPKPEEIVVLAVPPGPDG